MRNNPHVLEINAHAFFRRIQKELGNENITLADIPEKYFFDIKSEGFDAIWFMGVWLESLASRQIARSDAAINAYLNKVVPGYSREDIIGSQYSIYGYEVKPLFGGTEALLKFKEKLNSFGIGLILDFAGNHFSVDHPLTLTDPDIFVRSIEEPQDKELFFQTKNGNWLAHGKDPYFPPWTDTVQINHFNLKARQYMLDQITKISSMCDGLRCDMVMLMMNKVFKDTWGRYVKEEVPYDEFWPETIQKIREQNPSFIFGAEVYWGLEWEVQELGFDYTYDKILYDRLLLSTPQDIQGHLNAEHLYQKRSIRFISNHDEESPIAAFGLEKAKAAATVAATTPGLRLFTVSQLCGEKVRLPIQYVPQECFIDQDIFNFYKKLLAAVDHPCFHGGQWVLKHPRPIEENEESFRNILTWTWTQLSTCKLVVINYSNIISKCYVPVDKLPGGEIVLIRDEFLQSEIAISTGDAKKQGLPLVLHPYESKILSLDF
jgi:hypothetical protein